MIAAASKTPLQWLLFQAYIHRRIKVFMRKCASPSLHLRFGNARFFRFFRPVCNRLCHLSHRRAGVGYYTAPKVPSNLR